LRLNNLNKALFLSEITIIHDFVNIYLVYDRESLLVCEWSLMLLLYHSSPPGNSFIVTIVLVNKDFAGCFMVACARQKLLELKFLDLLLANICVLGAKYLSVPIAELQVLHFLR